MAEQLFKTNEGRWVNFRQFLEDKERLPEELDDEVEEKRFCQFCDSRGGIHKRDCTRPK